MTVEFLTTDAGKSFTNESANYDAAVPEDLRSQGTKGVKLGSNALYLKVTLADETDFLAGDTLFICGYNSFKISSTADQTGDIATSLATGTAKTNYKVGSVVLTQNVNTLYIMRAEGTGTGIVAIKVVRPEQKTVIDVDVNLSGVAINGVALSESQMSTLYADDEVSLDDEYVEAPTVTFTVQTETYYVEEIEPTTTYEDIDIVAQEEADRWKAYYRVKATNYTIYAVKPPTCTVTYMDGTTVLSTEVVKQGDSATKYATYENQPLSTCMGWFLDAALSPSEQIDIANYTVRQNMTVYGKFTKTYISQSLNIEQLVLDNGKGANIDSILTARGYDFKDINALDSLNDEKDNRNEPYLGLKIKKTAGYIAFNIRAESTIKIKFG